MKKLTQNPSYDNLLNAIQDQINLGRERAEEAVEEEKTKTYWQIGDLIQNHLLENKKRSDYGKYLFDRLSEDLGIHKRTLFLAVQFQKAYPIVNTCSQLKWSHFRLLLTVRDENERSELEERVNSENLSVRKLRDIVQDLSSKKVNTSSRKVNTVVSSTALSVERGRLNVFEVVAREEIVRAKNELILDLGFHVFLPFKKPKQIKLMPGDQVRYQQKKASLKQVIENADRRYCYHASLKRVVDGDTLVVVIHLGFQIYREERLRLRGIDAAEAKTTGGHKATLYLSKQLHGVESLVIQTYKTDRYGRYVADVFFLPGELDPKLILKAGLFLNQELLDSGLVRKA